MFDSELSRFCSGWKSEFRKYVANVVPRPVAKNRRHNRFHTPSTDPVVISSTALCVCASIPTEWEFAARALCAAALTFTEGSGRPSRGPFFHPVPWDASLSYRRRRGLPSPPLPRRSGLGVA